jgi:hypothetical protein
MTEAEKVSCDSRVDRATVYARGALVTRTVQLPEPLPTRACALEVRASWCALDPASLRALAVGGRAILAVDVRVIDPRPAIDPGPIEREVERLRRELNVELQRVQRFDERMRALEQVRPDPRLRPRRPSQDGPQRMRESLAASSVVDGLWGELQTERQRADERCTERQRALAAAELRLAQASRDPGGAGRAALAIVVQLAEATDGARLDALEIEYAVAAARWWPAYKVRLSEGARRARWSLDAFIAQMTGEDWLGAKVSLSTADLVRDVRLPTLPSLRLGRAQPGRRAFREPPRGVDELFAGYDEARSALRALEPPPEAEKTVTRAGRPAPLVRRQEPAPSLRARAATTTPAALGAAGSAPADAALESVEGAVPEDAPQPIPAMAYAARMEELVPAPPASRGAGGFAIASAPAPRQTFAVAGDELDPDEAWMDFDGLSLEDPSASARRGHLVRAGRDALGSALRGSRAVLDFIPAPAEVTDPLEGRGLFDCCYEGITRVDVPSDGRTHRVSVAEAEGPSTPRWRTVPRQSAEVFREAEVHNPFDAPLLGGPAEVFVDDALLSRTVVRAVERGGVVALGLGVEERVRVARNARAQESSAGLLGGSTQVDHHVTIELSSALGEALTVDVIDRVPFAKKDDEVEVTLVGSRPKAARYTQAERRAPIEGGLSWRVELGPGAKTTVEFQYRIVFSSKLELQGGNRRD